jgi:predicted cobalt transporter CbtA
MLNQLGGSIGIAVVALILETAAAPIGGYQGVFWFLAATLAVVLAATWLLPGHQPAAVEAPITAATERIEA